MPKTCTRTTGDSTVIIEYGENGLPHTEQTETEDGTVRTEYTYAWFYIPEGRELPQRTDATGQLYGG